MDEIEIITKDDDIVHVVKIDGCESNSQPSIAARGDL